MAIYILYLQNNNGDTTQKEVEAESSLEAVNNTLDGKWVLMSKNRYQEAFMNLVLIQSRTAI